MNISASGIGHRDQLAPAQTAMAALSKTFTGSITAKWDQKQSRSGSPGARALCFGALPDDSCFREYDLFQPDSGHHPSGKLDFKFHLNETL